jgi:hypothetical protein
MLVGYARRSTDAQDLTAQHNALTTFGVKANGIYVDHGCWHGPHHVDGFATLDTSDRQRRIAGYEEAVGVPLFHTMT